MATSGYQAPKFRSIILGIILSVILLVFLCSLSQAVKYTGAALMWIPGNFGAFRTVKSSEVQEIYLQNSPTLIVANNPGRFFIYTDDYDLLTMTMQLSDADSNPWMQITNQINGEQVKLDFVLRGLRLYDTPLAKGRPIFSFTLPAQARYEIIHPERKATIYIVPDYLTGNEGAITSWFAIQVAIIALVLGVLYARQRMKRMKAIEEIKALGNRRKGHDFWQAQTEKRQERDK